MRTLRKTNPGGLTPVPAFKPTTLAITLALLAIAADTGLGQPLPFVFSVQPSDQVVAEGGSTTLNVSGSGTEPLSFQWRRDGVDLAGATNSTLSIQSVQLAHSGDYAVSVSNAAGVVTSQTALLSVGLGRVHTNAFGTSLPYRLFLPRHYNPADRYPLVLFWHGSGQSGTDNLSQLNDQGQFVFLSLTNQTLHPCFFLAPQLPFTVGCDDDFAFEDQTVELLQALAMEFGIDPDRLHVTGLSMGGFISWNMMARYPDLFAAAIPMSGGWGCWIYDLYLGIRIPVWNFHAANDTAVSVSYSDEAVDALRNAGGNPIYTRYRGGGHAIWRSAYSTPGLVDWLMAQARGAASTTPPLVTITVPTADTTFFSTASTLDLAGTVAHSLSSVSQVTVTNALNGFGGVATGTTAWSFEGLPLEIGAPNVIVVTAKGTTSVGITTFNDTLTVQVAQAPEIVTQPGNQAVGPGIPVTLCVAATGVPAPDYQWRKDGLRLEDGGRIAGAASACLTISSAVKSDEGGYDVVASNAGGSVTSLVATLTVMDPAISRQPLSRQQVVGGSVTFSVSAAGTAPLSYQWRKDGGVLSGGTTPTLTLTNLQWSDAGGYDVVVTNLYGSVTSGVAALTFISAADSLNPTALGGYVESLAVQPDGKILAGGLFTRLGGQTRNHFGRLHADGKLDGGFDPGAGNRPTDAVNCLGVRPDGRIWVGGVFTSLAGQPADCIGRINADGTLDTTFTTGTTNGYFYLNCLAVQPDGKILVGGRFPDLRRLNPDGTRDTNFSASVGGSLYCAVLQPDGRILVGGNFSNLAGQARTNIGRFNPDGTLDTNFNSSTTGQLSTSWNPGVITLAVEPDGKILVGGNFVNLGGRPHPGLGRLNADGTLDTNFTVTVNGTVHSLALQADGKILVGGQFNSLLVPGQSSQPRSGIGRLNANGTVDTNFSPVVSGYLLALALQSDGKIVVGGQFSGLAGQPRLSIGRLYNTGPATDSLSYDGSTIGWLRGGTSPEVWRARFDYSSDGIHWTDLGAGTRVSGGWQVLTNVPTPVTTTIRARGFVTGGHYNASGSLVETLITVSPPTIVTEPVGRTNNVNTDTTFSVVAQGTAPLSYQWRKDGANIPAGTNSTLVLPQVQEVDQGFYSVVVSNAYGTAVSVSAFLDINRPPVADASAKPTQVISANTADAQVVLDGTRSSDPDGDPLQYLWFRILDAQPPTLLAGGAVAVVVLPVGAHPLELVVSDGMLSATNPVTVEVITTAQAVERLMARVTSGWPAAQPLTATLSAALASIERGNPVSAINQLLAFQNKVRAQVASSDLALAASFLKQAQEILDALSGGHTNPGGQTHGRFASVTHQPNGHMQLRFSAARGPIYILEASTNLVDWEPIGLAREQDDGTFSFEDVNAARFPTRYYRVVSP